jgi:hypothetical protein
MRYVRTGRRMPVGLDTGERGIEAHIAAVRPGRLARDDTAVMGADLGILRAGPRGQGSLRSISRVSA